VLGLNPNIIRNYFLTPIGKQVANLTFTGGHHLVKGSLSKFLVPKFLKETESLPSHLKTGFQMFEKTEEELLEMTPQSILKTFNHIDQIARDLLPRYACEILSRYSIFERTLQSLIWKMDDSRFGQKVSFSNPLIQSQLVQRPTRLLYPDNEDIFLEFVEGSTPMDLHLPLTLAQIKVTHEGELKLHFLELVSNDKVVVRLHGEEMMILFVHFILSHALNVPLSKILRAIHVPSLKDLKEIIDVTQSFKGTFQDLVERVQSSIFMAFKVHVSAKRQS
jgi:hypothetical protein